jgi:hypothetical protein
LKYLTIFRIHRVDDLKLIWGHSGFVDGWGRDIIEYFRDPANLAQLGMKKDSINTSLSNAARINHDPGVQVSEIT